MRHMQSTTLFRSLGVGRLRIRNDDDENDDEDDVKQFQSMPFCIIY